MQFKWAAFVSLIVCLFSFGAQAQQTSPDSMPGCIYNVTPPTLSSGQQSPWQCDVNGKLLASVTAGSFAPQLANTVLAGPTTGSAAAPTFRALVAGDIPANLAIVAGSTVLSGCGANGVLFNNGGVVGCDTGLTKAAGATGTVTVGGNLIVGGYLQAQNLYGGTAAGAGLNLQSTTNGSPSSDYVEMTVGGATVFDCGLTFSGYCTVKAVNGLAMDGGSIVQGANVSSNSASGYEMIAGATGATSPTIAPNRSDLKAGIGANAAGNVSIIADNAGTATEIIRVSGTDVFLPVLPTSNPGGTVSSVCWGATAGGLWTDTSGTICGISAMMFKTSPATWDYIAPADALAGIMSLRTAAWQYKPEYQDHGATFHVGLIADDVQAMDARCGVDHNHNYSDRCVETYLAGAIQELNSKFEALEARFH